MPPPYEVVVVLIATGDAFDTELLSDGEWNTMKQTVRSKGFITLTKWRKNNNPPGFGNGPFTTDNSLVIPAEAVYLAVNGLAF